MSIKNVTKTMYSALSSYADKCLIQTYLRIKRMTGLTIPYKANLAIYAVIRAAILRELYLRLSNNNLHVFYISVVSEYSKW